MFSMGFFTPTEISDQELDAVLSELSDEELEMLDRVLKGKTNTTWKKGD